MDNEKRPLVSVVIPTYNRIATLPGAIYSVLNQTYDHLELIIMDDGSEDGTEEYVKSISDKRVRYKRSDTNLGPAAARNRGAELAEGEYLAFQDSDDEWMPDKLEKQMKLMLGDEDISLVYSEFALYAREKFVLYVPSREIPYEEKCGDIFARLLLYPLIGTPTIVVKTEEFLKERGFNETLKSYEDYEFTLRFARKYRIGFVGEALVRVNSSMDSVNKRFDGRIRAQFFMVREMLDAFRSLGLLWRKLESVLDEADSLLCHDAFLEEMDELSNQALTDQERANARMLMQKAEKDKETALLQMEIMERISKAKADILKIYAELYVNKAGWSDQQCEDLEHLADIVQDCEKLFTIPADIQQQYTQIFQKREEGLLQWTDQLFLLTDMVGALEMLEKCIVEQI